MQPRLSQRRSSQVSLQSSRGRTVGLGRVSLLRSWWSARDQSVPLHRLRSLKVGFLEGCQRQLMAQPGRPCVPSSAEWRWIVATAPAVHACRGRARQL